MRRCRSLRTVGKFLGTPTTLDEKIWKVLWALTSPWSAILIGVLVGLMLAGCASEPQLQPWGGPDLSRFDGQPCNEYYSRPGSRIKRRLPASVDCRVYTSKESIRRIMNNYSSPVGQGMIN